MCAKKLEASRRTVRSEVDFVITFEELAGMFDAKEIDFNTYEKEEELNDAFGAGRGYAVASGVAGAIKACIDEYYPGTEVKIDHVEGLADCKKMLLQAKAGKKKRLSDRRNGMSRWMCCRSWNQYTSYESTNSG